MRHSQRYMSDIVIKAIMWNVWFARNDCIFNVNVLHIHFVILNIDRMILSWCSSASERSGEQMGLSD